MKIKAGDNVVYGFGVNSAVYYGMVVRYKKATHHNSWVVVSYRDGLTYEVREDLGRIRLANDNDRRYYTETRDTSPAKLQQLEEAIRVQAGLSFIPPAGITNSTKSEPVTDHGTDLAAMANAAIKKGLEDGDKQQSENLG